VKKSDDPGFYARQLSCHVTLEDKIIPDKNKIFKCLV